MHGTPTHPLKPETRYITEDVPFGLFPSTLLGRLADEPMPLHAAGIAMFSALYGKDFRADNDLVPALGLGEMTRDRLMAMVSG